jgi:hypothetical protein
LVEIDLLMHANYLERIPFRDDTQGLASNIWISR